ncbi:MAG TPA: VF530 family protein [bacterium]|nr:VF530 family protein [bacterium]
MAETETEDPLHGVTLQMMIERLAERIGWDGLAEKIHIRCFDSDPSVESSLKFLRRTPWAREKVELLYLYTFHPKRAGELARRRRERNGPA